MTKKDGNRQRSKKVTPRRTYTFGTGLTKHPRNVYELSANLDDPDVAAEMSDLILRAFPTHGERVDRIEMSARAILRQENMPDRNDPVAVAENGSWTWFKLDANAAWPNAGSQPLIAGYAYAQREEETRAWFAARVLECIDAYREAGKTQNKNMSDECTYQLVA